MNYMIYLIGFVFGTSAFAGRFSTLSTGQVGSINYGGIGGISLGNGLRSGSVGGITLSPGFNSGPSLNTYSPLNPSSDQELNVRYRRMREEDANRSSELNKKANDLAKLEATRPTSTLILDIVTLLKAWMLDRKLTMARDQKIGSYPPGKTAYFLKFHFRAGASFASLFDEVQ
jgi:hypothetical protein